MQIASKVKEYINEKSLLRKDSKIIVGVSGGADSMALLYILIGLGYDCIAAHCNFHLRGKESDRDFLFIQNWCQDNKVKFVHTDFDTIKYMKEKSVSLEMAARELRYDWFEKIRVEYNADKIAVAHHQDDSIETILINLMRGTGIKGLVGIPAVNGNIVRPLLCIYRNEILDYLGIHHIKFVTDSTNMEDVYIRNKVRLNIIPLMEEINPSVKLAISKTSENLLSTAKIYYSSIEKIVQHVFKDNKINIKLLLDQSGCQTILFEILHPYGFNSANISDIFSSILSNQSGKVFYTKDYILVRDRDNLILKKQAENDRNIYKIKDGELEIQQPIKLSIKYITNNNFLEIEKKSEIVYLDKSKMIFPLIIRRWEKGDRFIPFGMKGSKKVSDYFSDHKFSLIDKENTWLLCSDNKIIWIVGKRADDRFKINDKTSEIVQITLKKD